MDELAQQQDALHIRVYNLGPEIEHFSGNKIKNARNSKLLLYAIVAMIILVTIGVVIALVIILKNETV